MQAAGGGHGQHVRANRRSRGQLKSFKAEGFILSLFPPFLRAKTLSQRCYAAFVEVSQELLLFRVYDLAMEALNKLCAVPRFCKPFILVMRGDVSGV